MNNDVVERRSDRDQVRRRVAHEVYNRMALASATIWTVGALLLFVLFAAGNPRPIPMALMAMLAPLVPAVLLWLFYRPLIEGLTDRRLAATARSLGVGDG